MNFYLPYEDHAMIPLKRHTFYCVFSQKLIFLTIFYLEKKN